MMTRTQASWVSFDAGFEGEYTLFEEDENLVQISLVLIYNCIQGSHKLDGLFIKIAKYRFNKGNWYFDVHLN